MLINLERLNCKNCPAAPHLFDEEKISETEKLREIVFQSIHQVKLFLLGESRPDRRFFYDLNSDYRNDGLRFHLPEEYHRRTSRADLDHVAAKVREALDENIGDTST